MSCRRQGGNNYSFYSFLTSTLDGASGQLHASVALNTLRNDPLIHWIGGWVDLTAGLDTLATHHRMSNYLYMHFNKH
jgi:hypothetical protein